MEDVPARNARYWNEQALETEFSVPFDLAAFACLVGKDARILDVGCGYGRTLAELAGAGYAHLAGVDISAGLVAKGKRLHPQLDLLHNPGPGLPFGDQAFDAVVLLAVLTCIPDTAEQRALLAEVGRVLAPGGAVYVSDFLLNEDERNQERYQRGLEEHGEWGVFEIPGGAVLRHHSREHVRELFRGYKALHFREQVFRTMRGHTSNGFTFLGRLGGAPES